MRLAFDSLVVDLSVQSYNWCGKKRRVAVKATHVQIRGNWVREVGKY